MFSNNKHSLPTLLLRGKLLPSVNNMSDKDRIELAEKVPIEHIIGWFRDRANRVGIENRVLVVKSETASGKSTLFPAELYRAFIRGNNARSIICTQPRVLTAVENVMEILKHYSKILRLGDTIGWNTKYNKLRPKTHGLLSVTIGTLYQQMLVSTDEEIRQQYKFILIDETHERDIQTDITLYMLKNFLLRNCTTAECPFVVLMSATFQPDMFVEYFGGSLRDNFIWCGGETAGFEEMWDWNKHRTVNNYLTAAADLVKYIIDNNSTDDPNEADILVFLPGKSEIKSVSSHLQKIVRTFTADPRKVFAILQIESQAIQDGNMDYIRLMYIPTSQQLVDIDGKQYTPNRRVILTTNVAETGLTLENLKYVIDCGYSREIEFNPVINVRGLVTKPAAKSRVIQRRGRAGRKFKGVFYPLYPRFIYDKLPDQQLPKIMTEDISIILLSVIREQIKTKQTRNNCSNAARNDPTNIGNIFLVKDIDMVNVPSTDALLHGLEKLYSIGAISSKADHSTNNPAFGITPLGEIILQLSELTPESARMVLAAYVWDCSILDIVTVVAFANLPYKAYVGDPTKPINWSSIYRDGLPGFVSTMSKQLYKMRLIISDDFINGIILFNALKHKSTSTELAKSIETLRAWCDQNNLSYKTCLEFIRDRNNIIDHLLMNELEIYSQESFALSNTTANTFITAITKIKYCLYDGLRTNILIRCADGYATINGVSVKVPRLFREDETTIMERKQYDIVSKVMPKYVLYNILTLKYDKKRNMYNVVADRVSTLDGFISPDTNFLI